RYPIKRIIGDTLIVQADILKPGHDEVSAVLKYRLRGNPEWNHAPLQYSFDNDRWSGSFFLDSIGTYEYCIEAWTDRFATLLAAIEKWSASGEDVSADVEEMKKLLESAKTNARPEELEVVSDIADKINGKLDVPSLIKKLENENLAAIVNKRVEKRDTSSSPLFSVIVDLPKAQFSAWYEMFHRSQGTIPDKSATFADCEKRLDDIKKMGFDIIYLPPIHPIGTTNRRGPNNTQKADPGDPGSPWAIGSMGGGHDAINKELGTLEDFKHFIASAKARNIDVALDLAFQCSPDHPYAWQHPEWFRRRKDGTIRYAENPPKRYYDIYPLDFDTDKWQELWDELARVVFFWIQNGVSTFRVDNPHTKPTGFWEWLIQEVKSRHPETIFLSEAFTRPKDMKLLAKLGFTQSYSYFAWKNTKYELVDFLNEFVLSDISEYYRGNFFTNTPDILHEFLQNGGRPAFKIRLVLAATLSSAYGIYNGFELCENRSKAAGSEEYADSEKYQYRVWDWDRPGNIKEYIAKINTIRRENPALQETRNLRIFKSDSEHILFYGKWTKDKSNIVLVAVNLDPNSTHESTVYVPLSQLGIAPEDTYTVRDLITGNEYQWKGEANYVRLDPSSEPAHVFSVKKSQVYLPDSNKAR
ncbi:MAG: alpha-1,4-glucan--maltose-1-phosphate maltosyltransferase, partial [Thaumarchaeota archaeon]|nr:alpha-1,4-glucan--maltose-1-phosphate maltosyltransferase [Nitrososphaerota archaeon]